MSELEYPEDLRYTAEHEWVRAGDGGSCGSGITSFAQDALGDVVYVEPPDRGRHGGRRRRLRRGRVDQVGQRPVRPASRRGHGVNEALDATPELVNSDPYGEGWMYELRLRRHRRRRRPARPGGLPPAAGLTHRPELRRPQKAVLRKEILRCQRSHRVCALLEGPDRRRRGARYDELAASTRSRRSRPHEPTTMRLPGIGGLEQIDTGAETEVALSKADQATVDALRPGTALLVVLRGPNTGARFLLDDDEVNSGRHPDSDIFLDDVTVSRKHAVFRREGDTLRRARRRLAQRHLRQPRADRRGGAARPATRSRSASSAWSSTPARA